MLGPTTTDGRPDELTYVLNPYLLAYAPSDGVEITKLCRLDEVDCLTYCNIVADIVRHVADAYGATEFDVMDAVKADLAGAPGAEVQFGGFQ